MATPRLPLDPRRRRCDRRALRRLLGAGLVFVAGVFGGSVVNRLRLHRFDAPRAAAGALLLVLGLGSAVSGFAWF